MATTDPQTTGVRAEDRERVLERMRTIAAERLTAPGFPVQAVNDLCDEVRGDAELLVDAFGIPDQVLRAPIGLR